MTCQFIGDEVAVIGKPGDGSWMYSPADRQNRGRGPKSMRPDGSITGIEGALANQKCGCSMALSRRSPNGMGNKKGT